MDLLRIGTEEKLADDKNRYKWQRKRELSADSEEGKFVDNEIHLYKATEMEDPK